jgi:beta-aspartyl-peptidase (threonine type)
MLIVGRDAETLASEYEIPTCDPQALITPDRMKRFNQMRERQVAFGDDPEFEATDDPLDDKGEDVSDTVGALVLDSYGRLAAASSTGGIMMKLPGRAGDTPVVGCGTYCGPAGAVTCTGHGEAAMRVCLAKHAYMLLESGSAAASGANQAIEYLVKHTGGRVGILVLDSAGNRAWCTSTPRIAVGIPERLLDATSGVLPADNDRNR